MKFINTRPPSIPMRIQGYSFGRLRVGGREYSRDLIIGNEGVLVENWWRREGHRLQLDDIREVVERYKPSMIVVGSGYYGYVKVDEEVISYAGRQGISLVVKPTSEAVAAFNEAVEKGIRVLGAFHLTC